MTDEESQLRLSYADDGLPILREETVEIFLRDLKLRGEPDLFNEILSKMKIVNRNYSRAILKIGEYLEADGVSKPEIALFLKGILCGYDLLRRQRETFDLEDSRYD